MTMNALLLALFLAAGCTPHPVQGPLDRDGDGTPAKSDCDDADADVHPGADEHCDGRDEDCDGEVDEDAIDPVDWYEDGDGDGYGDKFLVTTCGDRPPCSYTFPPTCSDEGGDCKDRHADVYPGAPEVCDGLDNDCDGAVDEDLPLTAWYPDEDGDGYGDATSAPTYACVGDSGSVADGTDPDDSNGSVYPGAVEICDGLDNDGDGGIDEDLPDAWYPDGDSDGYGDGDAVPKSGCEGGPGPDGHALVADGTDCDDADAAVHPGAVETCDGVDQDCDGVVDNPESVVTNWYEDLDGDGWGTHPTESGVCPQPADTAPRGHDCDDAHASANPGQEEPCEDTDLVDNNCDGTVDPHCTYGTVDAWWWYGLQDETPTLDCWRNYDAVMVENGSGCPDCEYTWTVALTLTTPPCSGSERSSLTLGLDQDTSRVWLSTYAGSAYADATYSDTTVSFSQSWLEFGDHYSLYYSYWTASFEFP